MDTQPNGLALEYQRDYGTARGDLKVLDLINNPAANGKCRVLSLGLSEELPDVRFFDPRTLFDDCSYAGMMGQNIGKPLP